MLEAVRWDEARDEQDRENRVAEVPELGTLRVFRQDEIEQQVRDADRPENSLCVG